MLEPDYPIRTARLVLRTFTESDLDALHAYQSLPEVARFLLWEAMTREQAARSLKHRVEHPTIEKEGDGVVFAVEHRETGELVGEVNLGWLSAEHGSGELGFIFDPRHHGHGYAREAATEVLRMGFEQLGLHRIIGRADARNTASGKLMERLGMRKEAHFVKNELVKGEWADEVVYAMLAQEWQARP
ncbi:GNAT family N-acetyltransferase [Actinophytocola glycyrrhizae]|uniref:GNAT family N-acetyltransferase n=1 Tax=Actinophytocola glycyrrhizae TaxID=2044873 RepID=A0ABV9RWX7_9PSEU